MDGLQSLFFIYRVFLLLKSMFSSDPTNRLGFCRAKKEWKENWGKANK
jgi:hypothetical protein